MSGRERINEAKQRTANAEVAVREARAYLEAAVGDITGIASAEGFDSIAAQATTVAEAIRRLAFHRADEARIVAVESGALA